MSVSNTNLNIKKAIQSENGQRTLTDILPKMATEHMKRYPVSVAIRKVPIKTTMSIHTYQNIKNSDVTKGG